LRKVLHAFYQPMLERGWSQRVERVRQMLGVGS
jgi:hypothetical protein